MQDDARIRDFVRQTLGCACPEEVFRRIDRETPVDAAWRRVITVGDRLLVYLIDADGPARLEPVIVSALRAGRAERDRRGLNRLRVVLVAARPDDVGGPAQRAFAASPDRDDKTHLHVIDRDAAAGL